jgi:membrane associated rhomboid family serine protease
MWAVYYVDKLLPGSFAVYGLLPRTTVGLIGIATAPLLHGSVGHLVSNTMPLLILGTVLYMFYDRVAGKVFLQCYLLTGLLVWLFGRPFYHIGASGLIYGLASFLMFFGLFRRDFRSLLISIVIVIFYGSIFYGVLPTQPGVSWESHLLGGVVGFFNAVNTSAYKRISNF